MRMTEAQIRRIIKEELIIVLEVQDPTVKYSFLGLGKKDKNIAVNPEVRTRPTPEYKSQTFKSESEMNLDSPIKSLENLVRTNPQFRNILVKSVGSTGFVDIPTISRFIQNHYGLDQKKLDSVMEEVNRTGAVNRLRRMALRIPAYRESKTK